MVNPDIKHRTPTNWPYKFSVGQTIPAALTHSNGQVAFDDIWVQYDGCASDFTDAGLGKLYEPTVDGRSGTNNFYLAGSGNFVMNQIGHLPLIGVGGANKASPQEMQLCVNTLMWISQRKQCEVCAADQADQQMTHFVHRVNAANAKKILTALANGGSYWYPLSDCYELMEDLKFKVGPKSFYQTNTEQAYHLYCVAREFANLTGDELVYDLYTGTGTIANFVAHKAKKVIGIEYVPEAIEDAKVNSQVNNIENTLFYAGDMKDILTNDFIAQHGRPDVIITDPPRAGMHPDVINVILNAAPKRIVYVSCNPATQARDLQLMDAEYKVAAVQPVDMFPHTPHVENVVLLEKR